MNDPVGHLFYVGALVWCGVFLLVLLARMALAVAECISDRRARARRRLPAVKRHLRCRIGLHLWNEKITVEDTPREGMIVRRHFKKCGLCHVEVPASLAGRYPSLFLGD